MTKQELKVGDWIYTFESNLINRTRPFLDYKFHQIEKITKCYYDCGWLKFRKEDLLIKGTGSSGFRQYGHLMDDRSKEAKRLTDEYRRSK